MPIVNCKICNQEFYIKPSHLAHGFGKYCSRRCQTKGQLKGRFVRCNICGKRVWRMPKDLTKSKSGKFFCSKSCQTQWRNRYFSGERHPNWRGGEHQEYRNFLIQSKIKPVCQSCGLKDERILVAHHLDKNRSNNKIQNLVWLCFNCHFLVHKYNKQLQ